MSWLACFVGVTFLLAACVSGADLTTPPASSGQLTSPSLAPSAAGDPSGRPGATGVATQSDAPPHGYATRLVIPFLQVDLPVVAGTIDAEGNPEFPLCDVAQYLPYYEQPAAEGTTYLYAHAREGMLASMLNQSQVDGGISMLGNEIVVYTSAGWRHRYTITLVRPHATDYAIADDIAPGEQRLVVQTSEGVVGNPFKLQVAAAPVSSEEVSLSDALASPQPRDCSPPV